MQPEQLADDVSVLTLTPRHGVNAYLVGDVLVDAGYPRHGRRIVAALKGRDLQAHAITHGHLDHAGGSAEVRRELGLEVWAPDGDAAAIESGQTETKAGWMERLGRFPRCPVARRLREGDEVAGFAVLEVPGHSPGHLAFWREADRVLVAGDVFFNISLATLRYGLRNPPGPFTIDDATNRRSQRRLAELDPELVLLGHGPPVRGRGKLAAFVAANG